MFGLYTERLITDRTNPATGPEPGKSTRERILRSAKQLFAKNGYEHTSTSLIARQAGTSESQLMKHFGSKSGLLEAIFTTGWMTLAEQVNAALENVANPFEKLQMISQFTITFLDNDPEFRILSLLEGRRIRKGGQTVILTPGFLRIMELVDTVLADIQRSGKLANNIRPEVIRSAMFGMMEGMLRDRLIAEQSAFPGNFSAAQVHNTLWLALSAFMLQ